MALVDRLNEDLKTAMRGGETVRRDTIRLLLSSVHRAEVDRQTKLDDDGVQQVIRREARQRQESIEAFEKGGRQDLADREVAELAVLSAYLPQQLGRDEIAAVVARIIEETGATGPADLKKVMPRAMQELRGKADGREVNAVVTELLGR